jgi:hypothetical protein
MSEKARFFVIMTNGRAENLTPEQSASWADIIDWAWHQGISAGSNTPLPDKLFRNGKLIASDLWNTAWHFHDARRKRIESLEAELMKVFPQPWSDAP